MTEVKTRARILTDAGVFSNPEWQGSRITDLVKESILWTYGKILKLGRNVWRKKDTVGGISGGTLQGHSGSFIAEGDMPTDVNYDMPIEYFEHGDYSRPARPVDIDNWEFLNNNTVLKPTVASPVFCQVGKDFYLSNAILTAPTVTYTRLPADPVFDNDTNNLDIPELYIEAVIERVVMQIKAQLGDLNQKQLTMAGIDKFIMDKYQLEPIKSEQRRTTQ